MCQSKANITWTKSFREAYEELPQLIQKKVDRQLQVLSDNTRHPGLRVRKMAGMGGIFEARVDQRYRFTFEHDNGVIRLRIVGTHQIYQRP